jgi:hypothetical protein
VDGEPLGPPEVYSHDRVFVSVHLAGSEPVPTAKPLVALEEAGHPVVRIRLPEAMALGGERFRWQVITATAGAILGVNPFDEPDGVGHARVDQRAGTPRPCSKTLCVRSHRRITGATPRWCGEEGVSL